MLSYLGEQNFSWMMEPPATSGEGVGTGLITVGTHRSWKHTVPLRSFGRPCYDARGRVTVLIAAKGLLPWLQSVMRKPYNLRLSSGEVLGPKCHPSVVTQPVYFSPDTRKRDDLFPDTRSQSLVHLWVEYYGGYLHRQWQGGDDLFGTSSTGRSQGQQGDDLFETLQLDK